MQMENGYFHNFMHYNKAIVTDGGSEDAYGRTLIALAYLIQDGPSQVMIRTGEEIFQQAYSQVDQLVSLRGIANSLTGICIFVKSHPEDSQKKETIIKLADWLVQEYVKYSDDNWKWFEEILAYDNAMLPLALLHAYEITRYPTYLQVAIEAMSFLESKVFRKGVLYPVGNNGWCRKGGSTALFDQQPIDAMAMALFYKQAFQVTGHKIFIAKITSTYQWFMGANALQLPLYDKLTGGCSDGLQPDRVNENQGAESTISYWISYFTVSEILNKK
jgi:hypothetical protein